MLKMIGIKLEIFSDIDKHSFINEGIKGRNCVCKRLSVANNKYKKYYNPTKENKFIVYLDENNLYGWGMRISYLLQIQMVKKYW